MMRLVLDTNVLARVVISPAGLAAELFDRVRLEHVLVTSPEMLAELSRVLRYEHVRKLHGLGDPEIDEFVASIEVGSIVVSLPANIPAIVQADPDDDAVVATAVLGEADALCTRNRHLYALDVLNYLHQWSVEVIDDMQLIAVLRSQENNAAND
jgi:putative PIN family toxin of toxin-antitoxin system